MKIFKIMSVVNITWMFWSAMYIMHTCKTRNVKQLFIKKKKKQHMLTIMFTHELKNSITKTHREILRELNRKLVFWGLMSWLWHSINIKICWKGPQKQIIKRHFCEHWTYITKSGFRSQHIVCFVNWTYSSHWQYTAIQFAWFSHEMLIVGLCTRQTDIIGHCIMSCCSFSDWRYEHCILSWRVKLKIIKPQKDMLRPWF